MSIKIILFVCYVLILTACNTNTANPTSTAIVFDETATPVSSISTVHQNEQPSEARNITPMISNFILDEICIAPCLFGIIPGETHISIVNETLNKYLGLDNYPLCSSVQLDGTIQCSLPKLGTIYISSSTDTGIVNSMGYMLAAPKYLSQVIEHYGEPDFVRAVTVPDEREMSVVELYYNQIQTIVDLQEVSDVSEDTKVNIFLFFDEVSYLEAKPLSYQYPWRGYGVYP